MIEIKTKEPIEVVDITSLVQRAVEESNMESGLCLAYTLHTTTGITVNEAETGLIEDILNMLGTIVPRKNGYLHDRSDGNAHAHLRAVLLGNSAAIAFEGKRLVLGTWQKVLFIELDGPRHRSINVKMLSDR